MTQCCHFTKQNIDVYKNSVLHFLKNKILFFYFKREIRFGNSEDPRIHVSFIIVRSTTYSF